MEDQGLRHCSVLVADDSASSRMLLATTLHDIGVGVVNTVPNGVAAMEHLRHSATSSMTGQTPPVDLLITEWDMEPVGGMMLINWLRRHMDSPDRFTRTMIMSGELDAEKVERARNAGVNAVFAKPFSINSLRKHITTVMFNNPPFFKSDAYFGPDRRRHAPEIVLEERRRVQKPYSEVLGSGQDPNVGCFDLPHYMSEVALGAPVSASITPSVIGRIRLCSLTAKTMLIGCVAMSMCCVWHFVWPMKTPKCARAICR